MSQVAYGNELASYPDLWPWLSIADIAHVKSLLVAGVLDDATGAELLEELHALHAAPMPDLDPGQGDLYSNRDRWLRDSLGDIAEHLHTGRARREATTVAWQLSCRLLLERAIGAVSHLVSSITAAAERHSLAPMPDFTYLQHAHPTTLGHYLLTFAFPLVRDIERMSAALSRVNLSPAGSGSVNGTRFDIDREELAADLEFDGLIVHNRDAMWAPDLAIELTAVATSPLTTIDRLAEELQIWASSEFGYFEPADQHARTSVIMPQKKNPYGLAMVRSHARESLGALVSVVATNLTPTGQPDNRVAAYGTVPSTLNRLTGAAGLLAEHLDLGRFDTDRMHESSGAGFTAATEICDWMTLEHGVSNRRAHTIVGRAVRAAISRGAAKLGIEDMRAAAEDLGFELPSITEGELAALQDPATIFSQRKGIGSVADVDRMIGLLRTELEQLPPPRFHDFETRYLVSVASYIEERKNH
jgi:argininosuccinate lyase